ncbi:oxidoreductase, aldo/keto reductase family [Hyphomonas neptunium ATCC 15444]|uniref:Oxidoreductase, aldo/keto reductase family n=2 Tax=Hyphomonas TaxID=85 RepID=Q0C0B2_HYPNA|nr:MULTISPECIES: aldo/keto reductase [Hyphomonas]ABI75381.1 oxidoreductase, aldo/keto reductase family [Hyphomonas neptunium ATCC 15444]KCZ90588.1 aldo/keto reductase family oxidoreductase [Hyphomonas hirschiana VP5]
MISEPPALILPEFGLGAAGLGNLYTAISDETARETLDAAQAASLDYFDTAPFYGHGLSEHRVGAHLRATGNTPRLSTKVGRRLEPAGNRPIPDNGFEAPAPFIPVFDYSAGGIRASFEDSQTRLGVQSVDVLLLHDIGEMTHGAAHPKIMKQALEEALPEMAAMKWEGRTKWIGLGVNELDVCREVLEHTPLDVLLIAGRYTLLEHASSLGFLDECHRAGVRVIIGGAFNSGLLAAAPGDPQHYDYAAAPNWAINRAAELREVCEAFGTSLPAAALKFCSAHPAVVSVIPGARSPDQVRQIADWIASDIDPGLWDALKNKGLISQDAPV